MGKKSGSPSVSLRLLPRGSKKIAARGGIFPSRDSRPDGGGGVSTGMPALATREKKRRPDKRFQKEIVRRKPSNAIETLSAFTIGGIPGESQKRGL